MQIVEQSAASEGRSVIDVLKYLDVVSEEQVASELARALRIPVVDLPGVVFDDAAIQLVDQQVAVKLSVVPLRVEGNHLLLAMANPLDHEGIRELEFATGRRIRPTVAMRSAVLQAIEDCYKMSGTIGALLSQIPDAQKSLGAGRRQEGRQRQRAGALSRGGARPRHQDGQLHLRRSAQELGERHPRRAGPEHRARALSRRTASSRRDCSSPSGCRARSSPASRSWPSSTSPSATCRRTGASRSAPRTRRSTCACRSLPTQHGEKIIMRVLDPTAALRSLDSARPSPARPERAARRDRASPRA